MNTQPQIQIRDLCHSRPDGKNPRPALGPLTFAVENGEVVSLVGPAGCGKTTLLRLIAGILPVTQGRIEMMGHSVSEKTGIGLVPEQPALLPWLTSIGNILFQAGIQARDMEASRQRARRLLAWFGLSGIEECRPHELSAGAATAVAICRALVRKPTVLLLDDPFRHLDPLLREKHLDALQRLWPENSTTAIFCTGDIQQAILISDRILVLTPPPGRILETINVDLPRPRRLDKNMTPQIADYGNRIRNLFRSQGLLP